MKELEMERIVKGAKSNSAMNAKTLMKDLKA